jgi:hypothetical protein
MTSQTTYSAGSLRRRTLAAPVVCRASAIHRGSSVCAKSVKLASARPVPTSSNASATAIPPLLSRRQGVVTADRRRRRQTAGRRRRRGPARGDPTPTQQIAVDLRDAFDRPPPGLVVGHPAASGGHQRGRERDLHGAAASEAHPEVRGAVGGPLGAATRGLATPLAAREHTAPHDLLERRQPGLHLAPTREQPFDICHLFRCKIPLPGSLHQEHRWGYDGKKAPGGGSCLASVKMQDIEPGKPLTALTNPLN